MSQQINLLDPAFHKTYDWLTATPLAIATLVMLAILGAVSVWAKFQADSREAMANQRAELLKASQDRLVTMTKAIAEVKPDAQLANELANARALLKSREEVMKVLEGDALGSSLGFSEFLRGFARQTPKGLWLTSFTIGAAGSEMEIRGRMLNPALLPEYIRRLKTEKIFQGRSFASLTIQRPEEGKEKKSAAAQVASNAKPGTSTSSVSPPLPPSFVDFVLMPSLSAPAMPANAGVPAAQTGLPDAGSIVPNFLNRAKGPDAAVTPPKAPENKP